ncbi:MAG: sel1 repeat family protein [Bauldia sp.]|nr:sel1 repeat family protein [Bauldia sp.]
MTEDEKAMPQLRYSPVRDGVGAYQRGDYAAALEMLKGPASNGHALAQLTLGLMYYDGSGVPQDHAEAARWLQMAVDFGEASGIAEVMLGNIEAAERARSGAERGDASSMRFLGISYAFGFGVPRTAKLAYFWFRIATLNGCSRSHSLSASAARKLTATEIEEADCAILLWRPKFSH